ncbi:MAG: carbamoyltransferase HypF [Nitrospinota bacterium]
MRYSTTQKRLRISIHGLLQGIGFRPFVYRLAHETELKGWIQNSTNGVTIEVEGDSENLEDFLQRLNRESPPETIYQKTEHTCLEPSGYGAFTIKESAVSGDPTTSISPDIATCSDCLKEIFDSSNRRFLYPFTNCTHCGPRLSIIDSLPYDRQNISMKKFQMCSSCQMEYDNPDDRRFHAQPNACSECGPQLEFWNSKGKPLLGNVIEQAVDVLQGGAIIAAKGIGGFHLMVNAYDDKAVSRLRKKKHRKEKPFALMFPSFKVVKNECEVTPLEKKLLLSSEAPIVLLLRKPEIQSKISKWVAPGNPYLGVMLPSNPLQHILLDLLNIPLVATSGNNSEETICIDEYEAVHRMQGIVDFFLVHNRPIIRPADDSIVREVSDSTQVLRRSRGYAPLPISVKKEIRPMTAVGGYSKNTVAVAKENNIFLSQHIGNLGNPVTQTAFQQSIDFLNKTYGIGKSPIACDTHPDYPSTQWANNKQTIPVQHHVAHVLSCMAEHNLEGPLLGVAWDGSGHGLDGTLWGGEFFHVTPEWNTRVACLSPFPLPGGEKAVKEPRRSLLGLLYRIQGDSAFEQPEIIKAFSSEELTILNSMLSKNINCPQTSSFGRLFDSIASILGIRQINSFEGQAAMELEFLTGKENTEICYQVDWVEVNINNSNNINEKGLCVLNLRYHLDVTPMIHEILQDLSENRSGNLISTKFHNTLAETIVSAARHIGEKQVVLSGGCFQNKFLTEKTVHRLCKEGFQPYWHQKIPPNDGGLALGQIYAADWALRRREASNVSCHSG